MHSNAVLAAALLAGGALSSPEALTDAQVAEAISKGIAAKNEPRHAWGSASTWSIGGNIVVADTSYTALVRRAYEERQRFKTMRPDDCDTSCREIKLIVLAGNHTNGLSNFESVHLVSEDRAVVIEPTNTTRISLKDTTRVVAVGDKDAEAATTQSRLVAEFRIQDVRRLVAASPKGEFFVVTNGMKGLWSRVGQKSIKDLLGLLPSQ